MNVYIYSTTKFMALSNFIIEISVKMFHHSSSTPMSLTYYFLFSGHRASSDRRWLGR